MRAYRICFVLIPASFKLVVWCCSCVLHPLPCFASYRLALLHTWLSFLSCSSVVCLPCCLLLLVSACSVVFVRIRSATRGSSSRLLLRLLHGLFSSSLRNLRQDDHHLGYLYYHCHASCLDAIAICRATYLFVVSLSLLP